MRRYRGIVLGVLASVLTACAGLAVPANAPAPSRTPAALPTPTATLLPTPTLTPRPDPFSTATPIPAQRVPPPDSGLPELRFDVELMYYERWMRVAQSVTLQNNTGDTWEEVVFNVPLKTVTNAFHLDAVTVTQGTKAAYDLPNFTDLTVLRVPLAAPAERGDAVQIDLAYRVVIPPVEKTAWPPIGTTGWTYELIQAGEWYPSLVPYTEGEGWHTWRYHPVGDPTFYPLVNAQITIRAEPGITIASGGAVNGLGTYPGLAEDGAWHFQVEGARGIAFLASPDYRVAVGEVHGIPVYSYYLPDHELAGQTALAVAEESIELFEGLYGPYPYPGLAVAENGFFGGMEYSSLITVTDYAYSTYEEPPSLLHALISHEVAHQWWYGAVHNDQANEPWLDEALAFYSELLYFERYLPDEVEWWWQKRVDQYRPEGPVDAKIYDYEISGNFILLVYGQAARFMQRLRDTMGDEAFFAFVQDYYARHRWGIVTADDFFEAARQHTEADLQPILDGYFANPAH